MTICPCCSNKMLRHIQDKQIHWFCRHCYSEMPNFETEKSVISKTYNMRSQESGVRRKNVAFDTFIPILAGEPIMIESGAVGVFSNNLSVEGLSWWLEITIDKPYFVYYFGPFDSMLEAVLYYEGYIEDLTNEGVAPQEISSTIKRCKPVYDDI